MKKYGMLALATIFMFCASTFAQDPTPPSLGDGGPRKEFRNHERPMITPTKRAEKMAQDLGLSDAQKVQVQALFEKQDAKRKEQMEKGEKEKSEMKAKFDAERKANDDELTKIIGKENFEKMQVQRAEKMKEMKERHENKPKSGEQVR